MQYDVALELEGVLAVPGENWPGEPVPGIVGAVKFLVNRGLEVVVFSERVPFGPDLHTLWHWLGEHGFPPVKLRPEPGDARCVVSDRGFRFDGNASGLLVILGMGIPEPWHTQKGLRMVTTGIELIAQARMGKPGTSEDANLQAIYDLAKAGAKLAAEIDDRTKALQRVLEQPKENG